MSCQEKVSKRCGMYKYMINQKNAQSSGKMILFESKV